MQCIGICRKVQTKRFGAMYRLGYVRCNHCEVFLERDVCNIGNFGKILCPCCKNQVRYSARNKNA